MQPGLYKYIWHIALKMVYTAIRKLKEMLNFRFILLDHTTFAYLAPFSSMPNTYLSFLMKLSPLYPVYATVSLYVAREDDQVFPQCIYSVSFFSVLRLSSTTWVFSDKQYLSGHNSTRIQKCAPILTNDSCLTAHNWQKLKRVFLTWTCHEIYRDEAVGLKKL